MAEETGAATPSGSTEGGRLRLVLVTYEKKVLEVECDEVTLPGQLGYFGVLPGHVPMIALLKVGELMYRIGKIEHFLCVDGGKIDCGYTADRRSSPVDHQLIVRCTFR